MKISFNTHLIFYLLLGGVAALRIKLSVIIFLFNICTYCLNRNSITVLFYDTLFFRIYNDYYNA